MDFKISAKSAVRSIRESTDKQNKVKRPIKDMARQTKEEKLSRDMSRSSINEVTILYNLGDLSET